MTVRFTEQEWENIVKVPFAWVVSPNCPANIMATLEHKLSLLQSNETLTLTDKPMYK